MRTKQKLSIILVAALFSSMALAQQTPPSPAEPASTPSAQVKKEALSKSEKAKEDSKAEPPKNKFIERPGTGKSTVVRSAQPVKLPEGPLGKAPPDIKKAIEDAKKEGGVGLDAYQKEINLPGLKKDDPSLKPFVLHTRNGVNEVVKLSSTLLNRIATPFARPAVIDSSESTSKVVGSDVYFMPNGDEPVGIYIVDQTNTAQTIALTVIPTKSIPGQNIIIKMEDLRAVKNLTSEDSSDDDGFSRPKSTDYTGYIRNIMTQAVRGKINGFVPVPIEGGVAKVGDLEVTPELVFTGSVVDVYRYSLSNTGKDSIDMTETAFYKKGVKAVSFFPRLSLKPGERGYVFLLSEKPASAGNKEDQ